MQVYHCVYDHFVIINL